MKKYRVNASEYTNLCSMYDKLKCKERQLLRYHASIACGALKRDANMAFEI